MGANRLVIKSGIESKLDPPEVVRKFGDDICLTVDIGPHVFGTYFYWVMKSKLTWLEIAIAQDTNLLSRIKIVLYNQPVTPLGYTGETNKISAMLEGIPVIDLAASGLPRANERNTLFFSMQSKFKMEVNSNCVCARLFEDKIVKSFEIPTLQFGLNQHDELCAIFFLDINSQELTVFENYISRTTGYRSY